MNSIKYFNQFLVILLIILAATMSMTTELHINNNGIKGDSYVYNIKNSGTHYHNYASGNNVNTKRNNKTDMTPERKDSVNFKNNDWIKYIDPR
ncbi:uncharacterized protein ACRADG_009911 isoform 3-T3 [Cochliomyia hominivorax]